MVLDLVREERTDLEKSGIHKLYKAIKPKLEAHQIKMGRDKLLVLLREHSMLIRPRRKYARTTNSYHRFYKWPNLIEGFEPDAPEQLWVSDITYIRIRGGFLYLSLVTDAYSRKIVGFHLSQSLSAKGPISALRMALASREHPDRTLIHHSDRGIQYCCNEYIAILESAEIAISMTQHSDPTENAIAERVNGILKGEFNLDRTFRDYRSALPPLVRAIDLYNRRRLHASCDYMTPEQAHQCQGPLKKRWTQKKKQKPPEPEDRKAAGPLAAGAG